MPTLKAEHSKQYPVQVKQFNKQNKIIKIICHPKESKPKIIEVVSHVLKETQWFTVSCI